MNETSKNLLTLKTCVKDAFIGFARRFESDRRFVEVAIFLICMGIAFATKATGGPSIHSIAPAYDATGVAVNSTIFLVFDENVSIPWYVDGEFVIRDADDVSKVYYRIDALSSYVNHPAQGIQSRIEITLPGSLPYESNVTMTIDNDIVLATSGYYEEMTFDHFGEWTFTTESAPPDNTAPTLSSVYPADNSTNVASHGNLIATFSESLVAGTGNIEVRRSSNSEVLYSVPAASVVGGTGLTINPEYDLPSNTAMFVSIPYGAIQDLAGNVFAGTSSTQWNFTTGSDTKSPAVAPFGYYPPGGQEDVSPNYTLKLVFTEEIQKGSGTIKIYNRIGTTNNLLQTINVSSSNVQINEGEVTIDPPSDLSSESDHIFVTVDDGAFSDLNGNDFAGISNFFSWFFSTSSLPDADGPSIYSYYPESGDLGASPSNNLHLFFDEDIELGSGQIEIRLKSDNSVFESFETSSSSRLTVNGDQLTIDPTSNMALDVDYYVTIDNGAIEDLTGNAFSGFSDNGTWTFTTYNGSPPSVSARNPSVSASNVAPDANIIVTFSEEIKKGSSGNVTVKNGATTLENIPILSSNIGISGNVMTIDPVSDFPLGTTITMRIPGGVVLDVDQDFNMSVDAEWSFSIEEAPDTEAPDISYLSPSNNSSGHNVFSNLTVTFNERVQMGSGNLYIKRWEDNEVLFQYAANSPNVSLIASNIALSIDPETKLPVGTRLYVEMDEGFIHDEALNEFEGISGSTTWNFTTEAATPPSATSYAPEFDATEVELDVSFSIMFNEIIVIDDEAYVEVLDGATIVETIEAGGLVRGDGNTSVNFTLSADLEESTVYEIRIPDGAIQDVRGAVWDGVWDGDWTFTTREALDVTSPAISSLSPENGAIDVAIDADLEITFDEDIQAGPAHLNPLVWVRNSNGTTRETIFLTGDNATISGNTLTLDLSSDLYYEGSFYVEIPNGSIQDLSGNSFGISGNGTWAFTTEEAPDVIAPVMTGLSPVDNAEEISINHWIYVITFDENVQLGSGIIRLRRVSDDIEFANINVSLSGISGSEATINFNAEGSLDASSMLESTEYYIEIPSGAFEDLAGNDFAGIAKPDWSFTTQEPVDSTPPELSSLEPADDGIFVDLDANYTITFNEDVQKGTGTIYLRFVDGPTYDFLSVSNANVVVNGNQVSLDFTKDLLEKDEFHIEIPSGVFEDLSGNDFAGLTSATDWNFSTRDPDDVTGPSIVSFTPELNAVDVSRSAQITITFDEPVEPFSDTRAIQLRRKDLSGPASLEQIITLSGPDVEFQDNVMIVTPPELLVPGKSYYIYFSNAEYQDLSGNLGQSALTLDTQTSFTVDDADLPKLTSLSPEHEATDVSVDNLVFEMTFNEDVFENDEGTWYVELAKNGITRYDFLNADDPDEVLRVEGNKLIIDFSVQNSTPLEYETEYALRVFHPVKDDEDIYYEGFNNFTTWRFTTEEEPDLQAPVISSLSPTDGSTLVDREGSFQITFDESIQKGTGQINFRMYSGDDLEEGLDINIESVSIEDNVLTFTPVNPLSYEKDLYIEIELGAVTDLLGNEFELTNKDVWNFSTELRQTQTIDFTDISDAYVGDVLSLGATASSGMEVEFSVISGSASLGGSELTISGDGDVTVRASQSGNEEYQSVYADQTFSVSKRTQTISFDAISTKTFGDAAFDLLASATSGLEVTFEEVSGPVSMVGTEVTITGAGEAVVRASQSGNGEFEAANSVDVSFTIDKAEQSIDFADLTDKTFGDDTFTVSATASSGLSVAFSVVSGSVSLLGDELNILGAGEVTIAANQSGDSDYLEATEVRKSFTVGKAGQIITLGDIEDKETTDQSFDISASIDTDKTLTYSVESGPATISDATITLTGETGIVSVIVEQLGDANYEYSSATTSFSVLDPALLDQTIDFSSLDDKIYGDEVFDLSATATSGLPVTFIVVSGPISIDGSSVTILGAGEAVIAADQEGDDIYNPALQVTQEFTIGKAFQTISFEEIEDKVYGDSDFALTVFATSGLDVTLSVESGPISMEDGIVTIMGAGDAMIAANQPGDDNFNGAIEVTQSFTIGKATQEISIDPIEDKITTDHSFMVVVSTDSGLPLTYEVSGPAIISEDGTITLDGTSGTVIVSVLQVGDENHLEAEASESFVVSDPEKTDQSITFNSLEDKTYGDQSFALSATATSGLEVTFSVISGPATLDENVVTITGTGEVIIAADQAGDDVYNPAEQVTQSFTISKATQVITFNSLEDKTFGDEAFDLTAESDSELEVLFSVVEGPATLDGWTVTIIGAGEVTIAADQEGDDNYAAAEQVTQSFTVAKADQVISIGTIADLLTDASDFELDVSVDSELELTIEITGPASLDGTIVSLTGEAGTVTITVSQAGNYNYNSATESVSFEVVDPELSDQTITFGELDDKTFGDEAFDLSATASSGLDVVFSLVSGPATLDGSTVTITGAGAVTIAADQEGNEEYNPAEQVTQSFTVLKADQDISITSINDKLTTDGPFEVIATTTSGLELTYEVSGPASIEGTILTLDGTEGTVTVTVSQAGDDNYHEAMATLTFEVVEPVVEPEDQSISLEAIADKVYGDEPFVLSAVASSGLDIVFTVVSGPIAIDGNEVTILGAGEAVIAVDQPGDESYNAAPQVTQAFTINKADQTISFEAITDKTFGDEDFELVALASSGLDVTYTAISGSASIAGNMVHITGAGDVAIEASQEGDDNYNAASQVIQSFMVSKADQTITIEPIEDKTTFDESFDVMATTTSGLELSYAIEGPATVNGSTVTLDGTTGTVIVIVSQEGDANFNSSVESISFEVIEETIASVADEISLNAFPNPASDWLKIEGMGSGYVQVVIFDINGQMVINKTLLSGEALNVRSLEGGVYMLRVMEDFKTATTKLMIAR